MAEKGPLQRRDIEGITSALGSENEVAYGHVPGIGRRFTFGRHDATLDVYEDPPFVRVSSGSLRAEITGARLVGVTDSGVIFEGTKPGEVLKLKLEPDGSVTVFAAPEPLPEILANAHIEAAATLPSAPLTESPPARRGASAPGSKQDVRKSNPEQSNARIELPGICVSTPVFHRSAKQGKLIAEFDVEVPTESGENERHHVVVFDDRARKLKGVLGESDTVEVKGNLHTTAVVGEDGQPGHKVEIYAFLVRPQ